MKTITVIIGILTNFTLSAQTYPVNDNIPIYSIHVTTMNENILKGLLLEVKDTSVIIYPGKFKEWKKGTKYKPVEFGYSNIRQLVLKRKNHSRKKYYINGSRLLFNELKRTTK